MDILEKRCSGKICPGERTVSSDSPYGQVMHRPLVAERKLCDGLNPERQELLRAICDADTEMLCITEMDAFTEGFCLGMKLLHVGLK